VQSLSSCADVNHHVITTLHVNRITRCGLTRLSRPCPHHSLLAGRGHDMRVVRANDRRGCVGATWRVCRVRVIRAGTGRHHVSRALTVTLPFVVHSATLRNEESRRRMSDACTCPVCAQASLTLNLSVTRARAHTHTHSLTHSLTHSRTHALSHSPPPQQLSTTTIPTLTTNFSHVHPPTHSPPATQIRPRIRDGCRSRGSY
jgi:hypothetical protein